MKRSLDPARFDEIANHEAVRPWLGGEGPIETAGIVRNPANFCFLTDDENGAYMYVRQQIGLYEVHSCAKPEGRNRAMLRGRVESLRVMFTQTDALDINTVVPEGNAGADLWAKHAGFREVFRRPCRFQLHGKDVIASYRSLAYSDWVFLDRENHALGYEFHEDIHRFTPDDHGPDMAHDFWVGATIAGIRAGNTIKAVGQYNRFALHAGYQTCQVVSLTPVVLDFRTAMVQITEAGLQVLEVRPPQGLSPQIEDVGEGHCPSVRLPQQEV